MIVQHGEKQQHQADPGLTERGLRQAHAVAAVVKSAAVASIHTSPLRRAQETAGPLGQALGLPVGVEADLKERMDWCPDSGGTLEDFLVEWRRASLDRDYQPRVGDSSRRAGQRFDQALRRLAEAEPRGAVVVVSHGGVTVDFLRTAFEDVAAPQIADLTENGVPGGAITGVSLDAGIWHLERLASLDHVRDIDRSGHRPPEKCETRRTRGSTE